MASGKSSLLTRIFQDEIQNLDSRNGVKQDRYWPARYNQRNLPFCTRKVLWIPPTGESCKKHKTKGHVSSQNNMKFGVRLSKYLDSGCLSKRI
jgi:hypothetical protein